MSTSKEAVVLVIVANLVLSTLVVAGAFLVFPPHPAEVGPTDTGALEEQVSRLTKRLEAAERRADELKLEFADRLSELEQRPAAAKVASSSMIPGLPIPVAGSGAAEDDPTKKFIEGIGQMIQQRAREQRDRYIEELKNPTEKSEARRTREFRRISEEVAKNLKLDERDQAEVERILRTVDDQRRQDFLALVAARPTTDDIAYDDVKDVLDKSYEEETRMIASSLGVERGEAYEKTVEPFRQMIYMGARSAFPGKPAEENR